MIEAGWADAWRKPIVLVIEDKNVHEHGMLLTMCGFIVSTLQDGLNVVRDLVSTEVSI